MLVPPPFKKYDRTRDFETTQLRCALLQFSRQYGGIAKIRRAQFVVHNLSRPVRRAKVYRRRNSSPRLFVARTQTKTWEK